MRKTVTNSQIINANAALDRIAPSIGDTVVRFRIIQIGKVFAPLVETWQSLRDEIIKEHADIDDETGQPRINDAGFVAWKGGEADIAGKKLEELNSIETEVSITPIRLSLLADCLDQAIDYNTIQLIDWLIDDDLD